MNKLNNIAETVRELWAPIKKLPGYEVSNLGVVREMGYTKIYSNGYRIGVNPRQLPVHTADGFRCVAINGQSYPIHRLVASEFVDNPDGHPHVRHIDRDRTNNCYTNLAWVSASDSAKLAIQEGRKHNPTPYTGVPIICRTTGETFSSIGKLAEHFKLTRSKATRCLNEGIEIQGRLFERNKK